MNPDAADPAFDLRIGGYTGRGITSLAWLSALAVLVVCVAVMAWPALHTLTPDAARLRRAGRPGSRRSPGPAATWPWWRSPRSRYGNCAAIRRSRIRPRDRSGSIPWSPSPPRSRWPGPRPVVASAEHAVAAHHPAAALRAGAARPAGPAGGPRDPRGGPAHQRSRSAKCSWLTHRHGLGPGCRRRHLRDTRQREPARRRPAALPGLHAVRFAAGQLPTAAARVHADLYPAAVRPGEPDVGPKRAAER